MAETGHARNVEHFQKLISYCTGYGAAYNPSNADISVVKLNSLLATADANMDAVTAALAPWKIAVNNRQTAFDGIRKLTTRVVNGFAASGAPANAIKDAKGFKRKIDGARAKTLPIDDPATPVDESKGNSVSQRSFTQLVEHFDNLIALLSGSPTYTPNENELKIVSLNAYSASLKAANTAVINTGTPLGNARVARDTTFYLTQKNLIDRALLVKAYIKSLYGATSPQYKQVSGLEFSRPR